MLATRLYPPGTACHICGPETSLPGCLTRQGLPSRQARKLALTPAATRGLIPLSILPPASLQSPLVRLARLIVVPRQPVPGNGPRRIGLQQDEVIRTYR